MFSFSVAVAWSSNQALYKREVFFYAHRIMPSHELGLLMPTDLFIYFFVFCFLFLFCFEKMMMMKDTPEFT